LQAIIYQQDVRQQTCRDDQSAKKNQSNRENISLLNSAFWYIRLELQLIGCQKSIRKHLSQNAATMESGFQYFECKTIHTGQL
jgi:hypothetical protein